MKVWIDQELCTGDGLCEEIAPDVFFGMDDGLFYVKESPENFDTEKLFDGVANPGGAEGRARFPDGLLAAVIDAAEYAPQRQSQMTPEQAAELTGLMGELQRLQEEALVRLAVARDVNRVRRHHAVGGRRARRALGALRRHRHRSLLRKIFAKRSAH